MKTVALLLAALLAGCAAQPKVMWAKDGATPDEFNRDNGQCRAQAFSIPGVSLVQAVLVFEACMQGKGYYQIPVH